MDMCHYTLVKTHRSTTPSVNLNANFGCWIIMTHQCKFTDVDNVITLVWDIGGEKVMG